ncbi:hypothetical protein GQ53DRAFT_824730 [Thozetella sp. PMI_491]|nr:hypothetical protein GQ53DRAFT_824730 [Thozetella sp. PMI_491]
MEDDAKGLLFVNKTQDSADLSHSKGDEKYLIQSHVQSNRRRKQRKERAPGKDPQPWEGYTSLLRADSSEVAPLAETSKGQRLELRPRGRRSPPSKGFPPNQEPPITPQQLLQFLSRLGSVYPSENSADPFYTTVGGDDVKAAHHAMLDYTFRHTARGNFLSESFAPRSAVAHRAEMRHNHTMAERLRNCVERENLLYSTLAYASGCLAWMEGISLDGRLPEYFLDKALPAVREQMARVGSSSPPDTWFIFSLYSLMAVQTWDDVPELWMRHCPARYSYLKSLQANPSYQPGAKSRMHFSAIAGYVDMMGGWGTQDPYLMESIILLGKFLAFLDGKPPVIHYSVFDPGFMSAELHKTLDAPHESLSRLGTGFFELPMCAELREIVPWVADFVWTAEVAWSSTTVTGEVETWLFLRLQALLYRFLLQDAGGWTLRDSSLRFALLVFLLHSTENSGSKLCATEFLAVYLRQSLERFLPPPAEDAQFRRAHFWCLCTGAMVSRPSSPLREWYVEAIARHALTTLPERSEGSFEAELQCFLFLSSRQGTALSELVDDVISLGDPGPLRS